MKTTANLLRAAIMIVLTALCCSVGKADGIIYSNNFALGTGVNISNRPPTYAATYAGGGDGGAPASGWQTGALAKWRRV